MGLEVNEIDTVEYPSWWATSNVVRIRVDSTVVYEGATSAVEFLPQGIAFPYSVYPWSAVDSIVGLS
jgi:hypothetical protein